MTDYIVDLPLRTLYIKIELARRLYLLILLQTKQLETNMAGMDEREDGFEKKFAHDAELKFKAEARRNKLLGLWAAEKLGKSGDDAAAYAKEVVIADFEEAGDEDVYRKVRTDLDDAISEEEIREAMTSLMATAIDQVQSE